MKQVGPYRIEGEIARGSKGVVYRASDSLANRDVAIKVIQNAVDGDEGLRRFQREGRALAKLRHPNIVMVHGVGEHSGLPYLVMELVEGESLQARLEGDGQLPIRDAVEITHKLAEALDHAHSQGILHRDIKPANVIFDREGQPLLTDFGQAKLLDTSSLSGTLTVEGHAMGTPGYWPPEQARGERDEMGPHSDVYSLGATLYAMLTGKPPYTGWTVREVIDAMTADPKPLSKLRPEVDAQLEAACMKCLAKEPKDRFASASALAKELAKILEGEADPSTASVNWAVGTGTPGRKPPLLPWILFVSVVGVCGIVVGTWLQSRSRLGSTQQELKVVKNKWEEAREELAGTRAELEETRKEFASFKEGHAQSEESRARVKQGFDRMNAGDLRSAIDLFTHAIELDPESIRAHRGRAQVQELLGNQAGALQDLTVLVRLDPGNATDLANLGVYRANYEDYRGAIELLSRAIEIDPSYASAYANRAVAQKKLGDVAGALSDIARALQIDPRCQLALVTRGMIARRRNDLRSAIMDLSHAIRLDTSNADAHVQRGITFEKAGDFARAKADYERALELIPQGSETARKVERWLRELMAQSR